MLDAILSLSFWPFSFTPALYACGFALVVGIFGLIRRLITGSYVR